MKISFFKKLENDILEKKSKFEKVAKTQFWQPQKNKIYIKFALFV